MTIELRMRLEEVRVHPSDVLCPIGNKWIKLGQDATHSLRRTWKGFEETLEEDALKASIKAIKAGTDCLLCYLTRTANSRSDL